MKKSMVMIDNTWHVFETLTFTFFFRIFLYIFILAFFLYHILLMSFYSIRTSNYFKLKYFGTYLETNSVQFRFENYSLFYLN